MPTSELLKNWEKIFGDGVEWDVAQRMQEVYKTAKKDVSGNAECRRIGRMRIVLDMFLDELKDAVERAEQESV
jgi:hypothetical protein